MKYHFQVSRKLAVLLIMCKKCLLTRLLRNLPLLFHIQVHVQISILTMVMEQKVYL